MGLTQKLGLLAQSVQQDTSLNIGIGGAANASYKLQVTGATNLTGALTGTTGTFSSGLIVSNTADVYPEFKTSAADADAFLGFSNTGDANNAWSIGRRNTGEFWISNYTGNFNSGTRTQPLIIATTGAATFETTSSANAIFNSTNASGGFIAFRRSGTNYGYLGNSAQLGGGVLNALELRADNDLFLTTTSGSLKLTSGGFLQINTTVGSATLNLKAQSGGNLIRVQNAAGGDGTIFANGTSTSLDYAFNTYSVGNALVIRNNGNIEIGGEGSGGGGALTVRRDAGIPASIANEASSGTLIRFSGNGSGVLGSITHNGTNVAYNTSSDYRLKQDLKDYNGLELISGIKTYDYEWKSNNSRMYGVIAHELQEVLPYAVTGEKDAEDMQGVDYSKLVPILVKAIQEQQAQIDELKAIVATK
jgi:hypothetical protein